MLFLLSFLSKIVYNLYIDRQKMLSSMILVMVKRK